MTDLTWRQQAEAAFRSALDGVQRVTGSAEAGEMTALHAALGVAEPLIRKDEHRHVIGHHVTFLDAAFSTEHPRLLLDCGGGSECPVHAAAREMASGQPSLRGRWLVLSYDGPELALERAERTGDDHE